MNQAQQRFNPQGVSSAPGVTAQPMQEPESRVFTPKFARSLMMLRGVTKEALCSATGLQMQHFSTWLNNTDEVLSERSRKVAAHFLGMQEGCEDRLDTTRVHYWRVNGSNKQGLEAGRNALRELEPFLQDSEMAVFDLPSSTVERLKGTIVPHAISTRGGAGVVIYFQNPRMKNTGLGPDIVQGMRWHKGERTGSTVKIPAEFVKPVMTRNLTVHEFDELFVGGKMRTWTSAILTMREHGITPQQCIDWVTRTGIVERPSLTVVQPANAPA